MCLLREEEDGKEVRHTEKPFGQGVPVLATTE
jgi:hypothetical protein